MSSNNNIILLDLFSGIGGFHRGLEKAGFHFEKVFFSEVDKHSIANYKYNFNEAKHIGSIKNVRHIIRTINANRTGKLAITFGSPCQDFSLAGERKGMDGEKSSLIKYAIFLIKWLKPDFFIWENVKGTFSSNDGADFWGIIQAFTNIGNYQLEWQLLNTSWLLPQNRERIYLIGHLAGRSEPGVFPFSGEDKLAIESGEYSEKQIASCLQSGGSSHITNGEYKGMNLVVNKIKQINDKQNFGKSTKQQDRIYDPSGIMACIPSARTDGKLNIIIPANTKKGFDEVNEGDSINLSNPNSTTRRGRVGNGVAQTLDTQCNQAVFSDDIRRLTEIECERLQGFPDDWTKFGIYEKQVWINKKEKTFQIIENKQEIPKTQRYKQCGNAVTVDIVEMVGKRLIKQMIQ